MDRRTQSQVVRDLIDEYCRAWNEPDDEERRSILSGIWRDDGRFLDPMAELVGPDELSSHIGRVRGRDKSLELSWSPPLRCCADWLTFDWVLARSGSRPLSGCDVVHLDEQRHVRRLVGFWERG